MASNYTLNLKAILDTSDIKAKLSSIKSEVNGNSGNSTVTHSLESAITKLTNQITQLQGVLNRNQQAIQQQVAVTRTNTVRQPAVAPSYWTSEKVANAMRFGQTAAMVGMSASNNSESAFARIFSSTAIGAASGSPLGPWGMVGMGVVGLLQGVVTEIKSNEEEFSKSLIALTERINQTLVQTTIVQKQISFEKTVNEYQTRATNDLKNELRGRKSRLKVLEETTYSQSEYDIKAAELDRRRAILKEANEIYESGNSEYSPERYEVYDLLVRNGVLRDAVGDTFDNKETEKNLKAYSEEITELENSLKFRTSGLKEQIDLERQHIQHIETELNKRKQLSDVEKKALEDNIRRVDELRKKQAAEGAELEGIYNDYYRDEMQRVIMERQAEERTISANEERNKQLSIIEKNENELSRLQNILGGIGLTTNFTSLSKMGFNMGEVETDVLKVQEDQLNVQREIKRLVEEIKNARNNLNTSIAVAG